jgi:hypothetical protein
MRRNIVLTLMAMILAIAGVRTGNAQDLDFTAVPKLTPGVTNQGSVGAISSLGLLGASTPTQLDGFTAVDAAVSGTSLFSVGTNAAGSPRLVILRAIGEGTFAFPQIVNLATGSTPFAVAVGDIDLDGRVDVVVAESNADGVSQLEVFTGSFLATGVVNRFDRSARAQVRSGSTNNAPIVLQTGVAALSVTIDRFNNDAFADIAVLTDNGDSATGSLEVVLTTIDGTTPQFQDLTVGTVVVDAGITLTTTTGAIFVDAVDADVLNVSSNGNPDDATGIDAIPDIAVATALGTQVYATVPDAVDPFTSSFLLVETVPAGNGPVGLALDDFNRDNLTDIAVINSGSGNVSINLASGATTPGFNSPSRTIPVGQNPVTIASFNFNNDGNPDLLVGNIPGLGLSGNVTVLQNNGNAVFTTARTISGLLPFGVAAGSLRTGSQGQDVVVASATGINFFANGTSAFQIVFNRIYSATSLASSIDRTGSGNDVILIEQNLGLVFVLLNISGGSAIPQVGILDLNDLFASSTNLPTSATPFRDAQTNLINIAITDSSNPTANTGNGQIIILLNDGTGTFSDFFSFRQFVATPGATNILAGDFNNDDRDDLVYIDFLSNFAAVALNDGANFFLRVQFQETGAFIPVSARIGDINDDDRLDLFVVHQGTLGVQGNQTVATTLFGDGTGRLQPTGPELQFPNFALSVVGGIANIETNNIPRIVDFNLDGFPDFAAASTRGGVENVAGAVPSVTIFTNRPDSPGNFNVQPQIALIDDTVLGQAANLQLEGIFGGPGVVSGRGGDPTTFAAGLGRGVGGANYTLAVADFNADGSPDLVVSGAVRRVFDANGDNLADAGSGLATGVPGAPAITNFRGTIFLFGNETAGSVRVSRPLRAAEYTLTGSLNPFISGGDAFVASATGNFLGLANFVPDVFHVSLNGNIWVDVNTSSILNHAPIVSIPRSELNAPIGMGRKVIITSGQTATVRVTAADVDSDTLVFRLVAPPTGENPPSFVSINSTTGQITINSADINRGPGVARFRIGVEASDAGTVGAGGRLPLQGRDFFTLVVNPNTPPTIAPIAAQNITAGTTTTVNLSISDPDPNSTVTTTVTCDRGTFATISGNTLTLSPQSADVGTATCTVRATDQFGLSSSAAFTVSIRPANVAPTIASIADVTVRGGEVRTIPVSATDANPGDVLRLTLVSGPAFVTLADNGNGTGTLRLAPALSDTTGGPVTIQVIDQAGATARTTFNVTVQRAVQITAASRAKPNLFISGIGFGQSGAVVSINGTNVSSRVIGQNDNSITLKGSKKKLNLRSGPNQITVTSGGVTSNTFVLNLLSAEDDE